MLWSPTGGIWYAIACLRESRHRDIEVLEQIRTQLGDPATAAAANQALDELLERFKDSVRMS